jgi:hypothetical protein
VKDLLAPMCRSTAERVVSAQLRNLTTLRRTERWTVLAVALRPHAFSNAVPEPLHKLPADFSFALSENGVDRQAWKDFSRGKSKPKRGRSFQERPLLIHESKQGYLINSDRQGLVDNCAQGVGNPHGEGERTFHGRRTTVD